MKDTAVNRMNFVSIIIKVCFICFLLALCAAIWYLLDANNILESNIKMVTAEKTSYENKVVELINSAKEKDSKIVALEKEKTEISAKIKELETKLGEYQKKESTISTAAEELTKQVEELRGQLSEKESAQAELAKTIETLNKNNADLTSQLSDLQYLSEQSNEPQMSTIIVKAKPIGMRPDAQVIETNKENDFLVLNIGGDDGVTEGNAFFVTRDNKILGRVIIEKTGQDVSVARAIYKYSGNLIEKGDKVIY